MKDLIKRETFLQELTPKTPSSTLCQQPRSSLPEDTLNPILENLPKITELFKEMREWRKMELHHEKAMKELELQDNRWKTTIQTRSKERERLQNSIQDEVAKTDDISYKLNLYWQWIVAINQPLVMTQEINLSTGENKE